MPLEWDTLAVQTAEGADLPVIECEEAKTKQGAGKQRRQRKQLQRWPCLVSSGLTQPN